MISYICAIAKSIVRHAMEAMPIAAARPMKRLIWKLFCVEAIQRLHQRMHATAFDLLYASSGGFPSAKLLFIDWEDDRAAIHAVVVKVGTFAAALFVALLGALVGTTVNNVGGTCLYAGLAFAGAALSSFAFLLLCADRVEPVWRQVHSRLINPNESDLLVCFIT